MSDQSSTMTSDPASGDDLVPLRRALLSTHDKTGLVAFATRLHERGVELIASGGTSRAIRAAQLPVVEVSELTGVADLFGGRVKTLHPAIHGPLLAVRDRPEDQADLARLGARAIDLVVVDLYPFERAAPDISDEERIELIDIGGVTLLRSAAKNHRHVCVLSSLADGDRLLAEFDHLAGVTSGPLRRRLAAKAFARTAAYDAVIASWAAPDHAALPRHLTVSAPAVQRLRYGENPHQRAAYYLANEARAFAHRAGPDVGYNNLADASAAYALVAELSGAEGSACAIVKHGNPCGAAISADQENAFTRALDGDPLSAFGGVVAFDRPLMRAGATRLRERFFEAVIAPAIDEEARQLLTSSPRLRVLCAPLPDPARPAVEMRSLLGGYLVQDVDLARMPAAAFRNAAARSASAEELSDLEFAWQLVKHVKSNAIVVARNGAAIGIGAGQSSRVDAARIAVFKARERSMIRDERASLVAASDAFFPFRDSVDVLAEAGVTAIVQPGGSRRDDEVLAAANEHRLAMLFTGTRHFRH